ncbi:MAG TPA: plastocyanin/azurin family copper-binding protein [Gemmatimonadales bacterium]|nr:plastocyanin/azurin family copper-binding protein [Gemmatimonadales bacterium]
MRRSGIGLLVVGTSLAGLGAACSGDDQGPGEPPLVIEKPATKSGDQQFGPVGTALGNPLRVLITRDGEPVEGVNVDFSVGQGGSLGQEEESDSAGIATAVWTLGPEVGNHAATAAVAGAEGSPLTYTATATTGTGPPPGPTVQVLGPDGGNRFDPAIVNVTVGQTVTWVWPAGSTGHNVWPDDNIHPTRSGALANGPKTYSYRFDDVGTFRYFCQAHGGLGGVGMSGQVVVAAAQP